MLMCVLGSVDAKPSSVDKTLLKLPFPVAQHRAAADSSLCNACITVFEYIQQDIAPYLDTPVTKAVLKMVISVSETHLAWA